MSGPKYVDGKEVGARATPPTTTEMNRVAAEFWSKPEPHVEQAGIAFSIYLQSKKNEQVMPGANAKRMRGLATEKSVTEFAEKYRGKAMSRERVARLIAPKIKRSEGQTLKILRRLKIPK